MTSEQLPPALAERFAQVERRVRSTRYTVFIWVALAILLMWMKFYDRDVILSNKVSETSAAFETVASGKTGLYFFDANHAIRAELGLEPDGSPNLILRDKDGKVLFKAP
jgi:hypothetical protein